MSRHLTSTLAVGALALAGCGENDSETGTTAAAPAAKPATTTAEATAKPARPRGAKLKVVSSEYGPVVADRHGEALYLFGKEKAGRSECYGDCAAAWPPMLTKGKPRAGKGARRSLLGTTRRRDGKLQATYRGHPLYFYKHDKPGVILCQNVQEFGGPWLVVRPDGDPVTPH
jgi:predicted lipoprotein with Yx(FWY)xxD motif